MLKHPIPISFNLDSQQSVQSVCAVIHIDDDNTEVLDLSLMQDGEHIVIPSNSTVTARFVRVKDKILISDNVACTVQENGNIHIPIDNAAAHMLIGEIKIEVNIVDENDILTMQFPLVIKVNNTILADAEISPESEGTIPELLEEAREAAESATQAAEAATEAISTKQDKLTAGENITISEENVISATGGSEYDDTELRELIAEKAPAINVETEPSYDTDFSQIEDKAEDSEFSVTVPNNPLGYPYLLLSENENLLPNINTASQIGEVGGVTVEVADGTVRLNGTCTSVVKTWLGVNSGSVITMNAPLAANEVITAGMLYKGEINDKAIKTIIRLVDGSNSQIQESITGDGIYSGTITAQAACTQLRIYLEIPVGAQLSNYIVTPFCFKGTDVTQINDPSFPYSVDITDYDYLSTYPNKHTVSYAADTKTYIDEHSADIDMTAVDQHINAAVNPVKADVTTLNKKVTYITPEQYGAVGDGVADDTTALQTCLSKAGSANVIRALKYYKITSPVRIAANHVNVEINRIDYSGSDFAVKLATRFSNIKIKLINSASGGGVLIKDDNATTTVDSNHFEFNYINSANDCIKFEAEHYWNIVHNIFLVPWLKSTNGHLINAGNNCTENTFIGGKTNCLNDWCINNYWATNVYTRFSFEKNSSMICYGRAQIIDCRTAEALNSYPNDNPSLPEGVFIKLNKSTERMGHCISDINTQCTYTGVNLDDVNSFEDALGEINQKIADQDPEDDQRYFIACRDIIEYSPGIIENITRYNGDTETVSTEGILNGKMIIYWNKKAYVPNDEVIENITVTPFVPLQTVINNPTYFKIGVANCVINLNDSYCPVGINSFIVEQTDTYKAQIYNKDNVLVFDGENREAGVYQVRCYVTPLPDNVFESINMPASRKLQYAHRIRHIYTGSNEEWEVTTPNYILTTQDKDDIANIVLAKLPTTLGVLYGNTSN